MARLAFLDDLKIELENLGPEGLLHPELDKELEKMDGSGQLLLLRLIRRLIARIDHNAEDRERAVLEGLLAKYSPIDNDLPRRCKDR